MAWSHDILGHEVEGEQEVELGYATSGLATVTLLPATPNFLNILQPSRRVSPTRDQVLKHELLGDISLKPHKKNGIRDQDNLLPVSLI